MKMRSFWLIGGMLTLLVAGIASAQAQSCPEIVRRAYVSVDRHCATTERNEACYGNLALEAEPRDDVSDFDFANVGDIEAVTNIGSMHLFDLDEDQDVWGVALMRLQANLPDTLPGQNAVVILFGDVEIENKDDVGGMQAFYLHTGLGRPRCSEVPQSGILIQSPDGADEVVLNINGAEVALGSTVLFQTTEDEFIVTTVEGSAVVMADDQAYPAIAGSRIRIPIDANGTISGHPSWPEPYAWEDVQALPIGLLDREITIAPPMSLLQIDEVIDHLIAGELPCGEDGLPDCDSMLPVVSREDVLPGDDDWDDDTTEYVEDGDDDDISGIGSDDDIVDDGSTAVDTTSSNPNDWRDGDPTDGNAGQGNDENFVPPGQSGDTPPANDNSNAGGNSGGGDSPPSGGNDSGGGNSGGNDNNGGGNSSASDDPGNSGGNSGNNGNGGGNSGNNGNGGGNGNGNNG